MKVIQQKQAIFFGNTFIGNRNQDRKEQIAKKKEMHKKEAMNVVTTAFRSQKKMEEEGEGKLNGHILELQKENEGYNSFINDLKGQMKQLQEECGVTDDSQEQKDLEILKKLHDNASLTEEETKRLSEMGEQTEYQKQAMEIYAQADDFKDKMAQNQRQIAGDTQAIRSIKIEKLKSNAMLEAVQAKDKMLKAASKEAIAMMVQDVQETIDEKAEEIKEEAEKRDEKKEEQEERIEAAKESKTEAEAAAENVREHIDEMTKQMTDSADITRDIEEEIKRIMEEESLLMEDLKGISLDTKA